MLIAFICSLVFWAILVQFALQQSKSSSVEISTLKIEEKMGTIEKLIHMSRLKERQRKKMELGGITSV